jgi:hypothetical protein
LENLIYIDKVTILRLSSVRLRKTLKSHYKKDGILGTAMLLLKERDKPKIFYNKVKVILMVLRYWTGLKILVLSSFLLELDSLIFKIRNKKLYILWICNKLKKLEIIVLSQN